MSLASLYDPKTIAIIGASTDKRKFGGRPIDYMQRMGYQGTIYPVNPRVGEVQGLPAYKDVRDIEGDIDLALIAVPAAGCVEAARACAEAGVKAVVVIASGFAESDGDGDGGRWQAELSEIAATSGMRILGPNCMGSLTAHNGAITTFASFFDIQQPRPGGIAIATQSGAVGGYTLVLALQRGLGVHSMVTTGNESDLDVAELVDYLAGEPQVDVICAYFEGCKKPHILHRALEKARANRKPVIALKVGASDIGAEAAGTHTAALAGTDAVFDAVLRMHGAHRVHSLDGMLKAASACAAGKFPAGKRLGVVTLSGGGGVMAADAAVLNGLEVPPLPAAAQAKLKALMPFAAVRNPVDTTAQVATRMDLLDENLRVMLDEGGCDAILIFLAYVAINPIVWGSMEGMLLDFRRRYPDALVVLTGTYKPEDAQRLESAGFLVVSDLCDGVEMVAVLERIARRFEAPAWTPPRPPQPDASLAGAEAFNEYTAARRLRRAGVPMLETMVAGSADEAAGHAARYDGPVVLKLLSADVAHKSDIGAVRLGVQGEEAVRRAFDDIMVAVARAAPGARIDGALVAPMISGGVEVILGVISDNVFGPAVMVGLGGVFTEIFEDVAFRPAPFDAGQARAMIESLKGAPLLFGARGRDPADVDALADAMAKLSQFAHDNADTIKGIDINPFVVLPKGQGAIGLDAVIELEEANGL
ncbi:MAG: acetate--CoA ligase family protein [Chromatiales bacterium]|jgi:acetate---CoA ligase (ADP-forming)|nr:acetate--CoA ligase family protein [Chromatiales bacterium]